MDPIQKSYADIFDDKIRSDFCRCNEFILQSGKSNALSGVFVSQSSFHIYVQDLRTNLFSTFHMLFFIDFLWSYVMPFILIAVGIGQLLWAFHMCISYFF